MDGTHVGGSLAGVPERAAELGLGAAQVFLHNPRAYLKKYPPNDKDIKALRSLTDNGFPLIAHCTYPCVITNPPDDQRTINSLVGITEQLTNAAIYGIKSLVLHPGSVKGPQQVNNAAMSLMALAGVLDKTGVALLLENSASGNHGDPSVLADMIEFSKTPGVGICFDTAHAWGWGIDHTDPETLQFYMPERVASKIGAVHFNNSMAQLSSKRDRHGALAQGVLTQEQLRETHFFLRNLAPSVPFIIEATGDPAEIALLQRWTGEVLVKTKE